MVRKDDDVLGAELGLLDFLGQPVVLRRRLAGHRVGRDEERRVEHEAAHAAKPKAVIVGPEAQSVGVERGDGGRVAHVVVARHEEHGDGVRDAGNRLAKGVDLGLVHGLAGHGVRQVAAHDDEARPQPVDAHHGLL